MADLRLVVVATLFCTVVLADDVSQCYECFTSAPMSACHMRPRLETGGITACQRGTKRCVTERHQTKEGGMISIRRRCATKLESRFSYNRCDGQTDGTFRCLSYCRGALCNRGTGRLYTTTHYWNYDSPDYADYVFDPEQAVLDPNYGGESRHDARHAKHVQGVQGDGKDGDAGGKSGAEAKRVTSGVMMMVMMMVVVMAA